MTDQAAIENGRALLELLSLDEDIRLDLLNALVKPGASLVERDKDGNTALMLVVKNAAVSDRLNDPLAAVDVHDVAPYVFLALMVLIRAGADINDRNHAGLNALDMALSARSVTMTETLLERNPKIKRATFAKISGISYGAELDALVSDAMKVVTKNEASYAGGMPTRKTIRIVNRLVARPRPGR